jgi:5'-methylthioadenosine/S-adenosylhomocysteine nucleosidase
MNLSRKLTIYIILLSAFSFLLLIPRVSSAKTGIIVALNSTADQIRSAMNVSHTRHHAKREFIVGTFSGTDIILTRSPMGMINNAITTQVLIANFGVLRIISIAPAGGLADRIKIGDLVIASQVWQHDFGTIKPYGFIWGKTPDGSGSQSLGYQQLDEKMLTVAKKTSDNIAISGNHFHEGIVASGDSFIADNNKKRWIVKKFDAAAVDMGSAAIAQVCYANSIPCLILRMITDKADINARIDFAESLPSYRSTIDISSYLSLLLSALAR